MIVFKFEEDLVKGQLQWYLGSTLCTDKDKKEEKGIYEQLDAQVCGLVDETVWKGTR